MSAVIQPQSDQDYVVADISLADFGRKEIETDGRSEDSYCVDDDAHDHRTFLLLLT